MKRQELNQMEQILKESNIDERFYVIGEYAEESVCFLYNGEQYEVFTCEKGNKYNCHRYHSIKEAAYDLVGRLSKDEIQRNELKEKIEKAF